MKTEATLTMGVVLKNLMYFPAFFIGLSPESYAILGIFMTGDLVFGLIHAGFVNGVGSIRSSRLIAGVISKLVVLTVPLIVVWAGRGAGIPLVWLGQWAIGVLILAQAYSMIGHVNSIRMGKDTLESDAISAILKQVRVVFEALLQNSHGSDGA